MTVIQRTVGFVVLGEASGLHLNSRKRTGAIKTNLFVWDYRCGLSKDYPTAPIGLAQLGELQHVSWSNGDAEGF